MANGYADLAERRGRQMGKSGGRLYRFYHEDGTHIDFAFNGREDVEDMIEMDDDIDEDSDIVVVEELP